tara:strand:+ start:676 stop:1128 length:453 start_codon:yes stop_codon:yes gene_type:complete
MTNIEPSNIKNVETSVKPVLDAQGRSYATGKRKNAVARVWIKSGSGILLINGKVIKDYFSRPVLNMLVHQPLELTNKKMSVDTVITVSGGGLSGQAGAIRHGISKALSLLDPNLRSILKSEGLLTRDSRIVERKKYGRRKARRRFQFSKR